MWLGVLLALVAPRATAQYQLDNWTTEQGLPQNSVREIVQTRDGYLWFTTFDGLVRFDGVRFTVYNRGNSPELPGNRFMSLYEDHAGDLWATLESGQVVRRRAGRFEVYDERHGLPEGQLLRFLDAGGQRVAVAWMLTEQVKPERFERIRVGRARFEGDRFLSLPVRELAVDPPIAVDDAWWYAMGPSMVDEFWFAAGLIGEIHHFDAAGRLTRLRSGQGLPGSPEGLILTPDGALAITVVPPEGGLLLVNPQGVVLERLLSETTAAKPLGGIRDREGNYWFISNRDGLFRARRQVVSALPAELPGARHSVYPLLTNDDGSVWIGSDGVGLLRWREGQLESHRPASREGMLSVLGNIMTIHRDRAGELWINGLWRYRAGQYLPAPWQARLLADGHAIAGAMTDADGVYWIGTAGGLYRAEDGRIRHYTEADGLAGNDVRALMFSRDGALWAGGSGGVSRIDVGGIRRWTAADGLVGSMVRALHEDPDGTLWIGTYDAGLFRLRGGQLVNFDRADGLYDDGVFVILEDDAGQFRMCSNRGIHRVARAELEAHAAGRLARLNGAGLNQRDGMPSSECNGGRQPSGGRTPDGRLWFPTMAGVAIVDPAQVQRSRKPPPIALEGMRIDGRPLGEAEWLDALAPNAPRIVIRPDQRSFDITYTGLSFINSEALQFRYRLVGADPNWVEAGTRRTAYFSHLPPGDYVFEVLAATADGVWADTGPALRLRVEAQLWRRPVFWVAVLLLLAAIVGVVLLLRESRNRARVAAQARAQHAFARQLIASQEGERKRIAAELHDSLGQNLLVMLNRAQLGLLSADTETPAREQLASIRDAARDALEEVRTISHNLRPHHLDRLGLTQTIDVMLQRIADSGAISVVNEMVPVDDRVSAEDAITVYRVLQECLNNVLKHSRASEVRVGCERDVDSVLFWITDNGIGFDYTATAARAGGFGLFGLAERVQMLGGRWTVESTPGEGTTISVRLRAEREADSASGPRGGSAGPTEETAS